MYLNWIDRIGNANPQLFRELKGRLTKRNLGILLVSAIAIQAILFLFFTGWLPSGMETTHPLCTGPLPKDSYSSYATPYYKCLLDPITQAPIINWKAWWSWVFEFYSWALPAILLVGGVYLLIGDMSKEESRGTLNFIRTSPQSGGRILTGKLLGVPVLVYSFLALCLPMYLLAALNGAIAPKIVLSIGAFTAFNAAFCYTAALLFALLGGIPMLGASQGWLGAMTVGGLYWAFGAAWKSAERYNPEQHFGPYWWQYLPIGEHLSWLLGWSMVSLCIGTYWLWVAMNRRFRNPHASWLSKRQSYVATASFAFFVLGFVGYEPQYQNSYGGQYQVLMDLAGVGFTFFVWFLVLIAALTPHRQTIIDWARYRHQNADDRTLRQSLIADLLWGEKSPALVAIAANLLIVGLTFSQWILSRPIRNLYSPERVMNQSFAALAMLVSGGLFILICAAIVQMALFMKVKHRNIWAVVGVGTWTIMPPIVLTLLFKQPDNGPMVWLLTSVGIATLEHVQVMDVAMSALIQVLAVGLFSTHLSRQIRQVGASEMKALMAKNASMKAIG